MKTTKLFSLFGLFAIMALVGAAPLSAGVISATVGNTASGFNPGDTPDAFAIAAAWAGQAAPFNAPCGDDSLDAMHGGNCDATWTFSYSPIANTILSATLTIGMVDSDSGSPGSQLALLTVAGMDFTSGFNTVLENAADPSDVYNAYVFTLPGTVLAALAAGSTDVHLTLQGPVQTPSLFPPPDFVTEPGNGAALIFSELDITTQDVTLTPEPSVFLTLGVGLACLGAARRRKR